MTIGAPASNAFSMAGTWICDARPSARRLSTCSAPALVRKKVRAFLRKTRVDVTHGAVAGVERQQTDEAHVLAPAQVGQRRVDLVPDVHVHSLAATPSSDRSHDRDERFTTV